MTRTLTAALVLVAAVGADWPQFRGPGGAGVAADDAKPPTVVGVTKNVKWAVPVPPGYSSPVVVGDKLFLTAFTGGKLWTLAYATADGKELWRKEAPCTKLEAFHKTEGSPAASTPAADGERVVSYFGSCGLFAYDHAGNELWRYELPTAETNNDFGTGTSPVLADGLVVLLRDMATHSKLLAVDAKTGTRSWEVKRDGYTTTYGSPCVWDAAGGKQVVAVGKKAMVGYDLRTGTEKWSLPGMPSVPCTTPVVAGGRLLFAGWSPGGADFKLPEFDALLKQGDKDGDGKLSKAESADTFIKDFFDSNDTNKDGFITREEWDAAGKFLASGKNLAVAVTPGGSGDVSKTNVAWRADKGGLPYVPSPLVYQGIMYTIAMNGRLSARDAATGKEHYLDEAVGLSGAYSSPVAANGYVYLCGLDKSVVVMKAGDVPEKVSATKLDDRVAATPAVVGDVLYVRTGKTLFAFAAGK